jgi:hypothetical protein
MSDAVMIDHGCTDLIGTQGFCRADDFGCYYLKNPKGQICAVGVRWPIRS